VTWQCRPPSAATDVRVATCLGFPLMNGIGLHNVELIMAITLLIVTFAAAVSTVLLHIDHRLRRQV
jgi:ABC-type proline/glycine betaine transport system permease subunit